MRIFSIVVSIMTLAALTYAVGKHEGHASGMSHGIIKGCQQVVDIVVSDRFEPVCLINNGLLSVQLTNPETGEIQIEALTNE